jgi:hypothetical protein
VEEFRDFTRGEQRAEFGDFSHCPGVSLGVHGFGSHDTSSRSLALDSRVLAKTRGDLDGSLSAVPATRNRITPNYLTRVSSSHLKG